VTRYQPTPHEQAQRKKKPLAERVEKLSRVRILEVVCKGLPETIARPDLEMVALDYFRRLGMTTNSACSGSTHGQRRKVKPRGARTSISFREHGPK
jgi:hypothetical protein